MTCDRMRQDMGLTLHLVRDGGVASMLLSAAISVDVQLRISTQIPK